MGLIFSDCNGFIVKKGGLRWCCHLPENGKKQINYFNQARDMLSRPVD
ncbi:hypothetical protein VU04_11110 [Desulfobulbus sp. TB]|nr:hypothetical protein [Desulfobulbus sp. TB]